MQDLNHALANLRAGTGITTLEFDAAGNLSLLFDGETQINLSRIDNTTAELWTVIERFGRASDPAVLRLALEANYLGEGTGAARISLTPGGDSFTLCQRIAVGPLSDEQFTALLLDFLKYVTFWNSADRFAPTPASTDPQPDFSGVIIRG